MPTDETNSRPKPLPSTFQQVVENMENIKLEILPIIDIIKNTILPNWDPNKPLDVDTDNDVVYDPDTGTMRVIGITVIIEHKDEDLPPDQYLRDITWELKNANVIGLAGKPGITLDYVTLRTVKMTRATGINYPAWQCAFGDGTMEMYYRQARPDNTWGDWVRVIDLKRILEQDPEIFKQCLLDLLEIYPDIFKEYLENIFNRYPDMFTEIIETASHRQILESNTQPEEGVQEIGDYWFQPIGTGTTPDPGPNPGPDDPPNPFANYALQSIETDAIEVITSEVAKAFRTQNVDPEGDPESGGDFSLETAG